MEPLELLEIAKLSREMRAKWKLARWPPWRVALLGVLRAVEIGAARAA